MHVHNGFKVFHQTVTYTQGRQLMVDLLQHASIPRLGDTAKMILNVTEVLKQKGKQILHNYLGSWSYTILRYFKFMYSKEVASSLLVAKLQPKNSMSFYSH